MIETIASKIATAILTPFLLFAGLFGGEPAPQVQEDALGAQLPQGVALFETSLASAIQSSSTEMTLVANSVRGGTSLSGYNCFTIDIGSSESEFVCGTVSGTSVTGLERGISPDDGTTQVTALKFPHRRGAKVQITDFPLIQRMRDVQAGETSFENVVSYAPGVTPSGADDIADVGYVLSTITGTSTIAFDKLSPGATAGETLATGTIVYFKKSDQRWYKLDVDDTTHYQDTEVGCTAGVGATAGNVNGGVILRGLCPQVNLTAGANYFASSTAGATSTATTSQPLGVARSTTQLYFNPDLIDSSVYVPTTFTATTTFTNAVSGIATSTVRYITASSTWTKPSSPTFKYVVVEMVGGGGAGGDSEAVDASGAGGGGSGAYARFRLSAAELPSTVVVQIGAAATSTTATPVNSTIFTGYATATAGVKGATPTTGSGGGSAGGAGGTVTVSNVSDYLAIAGTSGANGASFTTASASGGNGASNPLGNGGGGGYIASNTSDAGDAGTGYGSGGGGGATGTAAAAGGVGKNGIVIITEYY